MNASETVWVHTQSYAGRLKWAGVVIKRNPKRSRVRYGFRGVEVEKLVPNRAITPRSEDNHTQEVHRGTLTC